RQRSCRPLRYGLPSVSPVKSGISRAITAKRLAGQRPTRRPPPLIGSFGRPIVPDPAAQAFLADLACGEGEDDRRGMRRGGSKGYVVAAQEDHHGVERDALVAVHKRMIAGKAERIGCSECSHIRLSVIPLVDWPQDGGLKKATIPNAFRSAEYCQLLGMHVD